MSPKILYSADELNFFYILWFQIETKLGSATVMLVTDAGNKMLATNSPHLSRKSCRVDHQHPKIQISILSPTSENCHQHSVINILLCLHCKSIEHPKIGAVIVRTYLIRVSLFKVASVSIQKRKKAPSFSFFFTDWSNKKFFRLFVSSKSRRILF